MTSPPRGGGGVSRKVTRGDMGGRGLSKSDVTSKIIFFVIFSWPRSGKKFFFRGGGSSKSDVTLGGGSSKSDLK